MKKIIAALTLTAAIPAHSALVNSGFETADLSSWDTSTNVTGAAVATTLDDGYTATSGDYFAALTANASISQAIAWGAGDVLSFDWAFNAKDLLPYNDFSLFTVTNAAGTIIDGVKLSDVLATGAFGSTAWDTMAYTFGAAGSGFVNFGVWDALDNINNSKLYLDNMSLEEVPIPAAAFLFLPAIAGLIRLRRRSAE